MAEAEMETLVPALSITGASCQGCAKKIRAYNNGGLRGVPWIVWQRHSQRL